MGVDAVTILVDDEGAMHRAADCALRWLNQQPEHTPDTSYAFIVEFVADGRISLTGVPVEVLPDIRVSGVEFEVLADPESRDRDSDDQEE